MTPLKYRSIFLSDLHLGTRWCRAANISGFLSSVECDNLYLVGDIIDGWNMGPGGSWPASHSSVLRSILSLGGVRIRSEAVHTGADGRRYLVVHGHQFDVVMLYSRWLAWAGDRAYSFTQHLNTGINFFRSLAGREYWSLSSFLKDRVKKAVKYFSRYESRIARSVREMDASGIICGHIHNPAVRAFQGVKYFNCGDWVDHCSALVEHLDGVMEIIRWFDRKGESPAPRSAERVLGVPAAD
jgi:UDP-2,3-diacylglucosamine pyrophosphatase LpxH